MILSIPPSQLVCAPSETQVLFLFPYVSPVGPVATLSNGLPLGCVLRSLEGEVQEQEENSPAPSIGRQPPCRPHPSVPPLPLQGRHSGLGVPAASLHLLLKGKL